MNGAVEMEQENKDFGASVVRTFFLPLVLASLTKLGLDVASIDMGELEWLLQFSVGWSGYAIVRALEVYVSPKWGYILGLSQNKPTYLKE